LRVTNAKSIAWGGPGNDSATLRAKNTAAAGGPGSDRLVSMTSGKSLLRGGPGKDILIGGPGKTLINALDGKGGDTITCNSRRNVVLLDAGDRTNGPCKIIKRR
jgi:Ca2+-binding RTX toxin-like protein